MNTSLNNINKAPLALIFSHTNVFTVCRSRGISNAMRKRIDDKPLTQLLLSVFPYIRAAHKKGEPFHSTVARWNRQGVDLGAIQQLPQQITWPWRALWFDQRQSAIVATRATGQKNSGAGLVASHVTIGDCPLFHLPWSRTSPSSRSNVHSVGGSAVVWSPIGRPYIVTHGGSQLTPLNENFATTSNLRDHQIASVDRLNCVVSLWAIPRPGTPACSYRFTDQIRNIAQVFLTSRAFFLVEAGKETAVWAYARGSGKLHEVWKSKTEVRYLGFTQAGLLASVGRSIVVCSASTGRPSEGKPLFTADPGHKIRLHQAWERLVIFRVHPEATFNLSRHVHKTGVYHLFHLPLGRTFYVQSANGSFAFDGRRLAHEFHDSAHSYIHISRFTQTGLEAGSTLRFTRLPGGVSSMSFTPGKLVVVGRSGRVFTAPLIDGWEAQQQPILHCEVGSSGGDFRRIAILVFGLLGSAIVLRRLSSTKLTEWLVRSFWSLT